jgi:hypothetical protein
VGVFDCIQDTWQRFFANGEGMAHDIGDDQHAKYLV